MMTDESLLPFPTTAQASAEFYAELPATTDAPCPNCGGPTIPPQADEVGHYCEGCGRTHDAATGRLYFL